MSLFLPQNFETCWTAQNNTQSYTYVIALGVVLLLSTKMILHFTALLLPQQLLFAGPWTVDRSQPAS